jgi:hypothetical protein
MPDIVVNDITPRNQYTAALGQVMYNYTFAIFQPTDLNVYYNPVGGTVNDANNLLTYNVNYTVLNNNPPFIGGTITLLIGGPIVAIQAGDTITIVRNMPYTFLNNFINGGLLAATTLNTDFDSSVMLTQQDKMYDRLLSIHYNNSDIINASVTPPLNGIDNIVPVLPPNSIWMKNAANNQIVAVTVPSIAGPGGSVVPSVINTFPIYANTNGTIQSSTFLAPTTQGTLGAPMISNGANPAQLSFAPNSGFVYEWLQVNVNTQMLSNVGYIVGAAVTLTLPVVAPFGTIIKICYFNIPGAMTIAQNAGQQISWVGHNSTVGIGGHVTMGAANEDESMTLLCVLSNTNWVIIDTTATDLAFV